MRVGGINNDVATLHHRLVYFLIPQILGAEVAICEVIWVVLFTEVHVSFPLALESDWVISKIYDLQINQAGNFGNVEGEVAFQDDDVSWLDGLGCLTRTQLPIKSWLDVAWMKS